MWHSSKTTILNSVIDKSGKSIFNIKLYINNESLIRGSDTKIITLQGCKLIGENFSVSSTADAPLMLSYNFMFKDIERG